MSGTVSGRILPTGNGLRAAHAYLYCRTDPYCFRLIVSCVI